MNHLLAVPAVADGVRIPRPLVRVRSLPGGIVEWTLSIQTGPGTFMHFTARVRESDVARAMGHEPGVHGLFGSIAKAVKGVAHITGADKVLKIASAALHNPLVQAAVPGLGLAARSMDAARGLLAATHAAKSGDPRAKQLIQAAAETVREGGPEAPVMVHAARMAGRMYRIAVIPE